MEIDLKSISMNTVTGRKVYPFAMTPDQVELETIAHHLAVQARWQGATRHPHDETRLMLSVAEHSVHVMTDVYIVQGRADLALQALLHDATEAYVPDLIRPLKYSPVFRESFCTLEDHIWAAVAERFGLPAEMDPAVKEADDAICHTEWNTVVPHGPEETWKSSLAGAARVSVIQPKMLPPHKARDLFLNAFEEATLLQRATQAA